MTARQVVQIARYVWASPTTLVGLVAAVAALVTGGRWMLHSGVLEVHGGLAGRALRRLRVAAMTLGHVVLAVDEPAQDLCRDHERVHVRQVERWGPLFLPAYGLASLAAWWRGQDPYRGNRFEREAYGEDGRRHA